MLFKQLSVYLINLNTLPSIDELDDKLQSLDCQFKPCGSFDWDSSGFINPSQCNDAMVSSIKNSCLVKLKTEEKVLPAAAVKNAVDSRISGIEEVECRKVGRKERRDIKENVIDELLPKALTKSFFTDGIIDIYYGLLLINQANTNKAELLLTKLRDALGGLDASLPRTKQSPSSLMTDWLLNGSAAGGFNLDDFCELKGLGDDTATVRVVGKDLTTNEVINHARNGMIVTQLGLCWNEQVRFVLAQDFTLKRIQFMDISQDDFSGEDKESLMMEEQLLNTDTLSNVVNELAELCGGWID